MPCCVAVVCSTKVVAARAVICTSLRGAADIRHQARIGRLEARRAAQREIRRLQTAELQGVAIVIAAGRVVAEREAVAVGRGAGDGQLDAADGERLAGRIGERPGGNAAAGAETVGAAVVGQRHVTGERQAGPIDHATAVDRSGAGVGRTRRSRDRAGRGDVAGVRYGDANLARRGQRGRRAVEAEEIAAGRTVERLAQLVLRVEAIDEIHRQLAERALRRIQGLAAERQQPAELAAGEHRFGHDRRSAAGENLADGHALRIGRVGDGRQLVGLVAHHQRLAVADEHRDRTVALRHGIDLDDLVQLADQLIALVAQVVCRLAGAGRLGALDALVDLGNAVGVGVDALDLAGDLRIDVAANLAHAAVEQLEARSQRLARGNRALPRRRRRRIRREILHRTEEALQRRRQAGFRVRQQVVELADLRFIGIEFG